MLKSIINSADVILCLGGSLPEREYFPNDKIIIAADGAANNLCKLGIKPNFIIGDLDSVELSNFLSTQVIHNGSQDKTDFNKCLDYIQHHKMGSVLIYGVSGGYLDHILGNINIILACNLKFYSEGIYGLIIDKEIILDLPKDTKISLFGFNAVVTTRGLKWNLNESLLNFPGDASLSNRVLENKVSIRVSQGQVLALIHEKAIIDAGLY